MTEVELVEMLTVFSLCMNAVLTSAVYVLWILFEAETH